MGCNKGYNYVGETFGRLTVLKDTGKRDIKKGKIWLCRCLCGRKTEGTTVHLNSGYKRSCGCLLKRSRAKRSKTPSVS